MFIGSFGRVQKHPCMSRAIKDGYKRLHTKGIIEILNWSWKRKGLYDVPNNRLHIGMILTSQKLRSKICQKMMKI